MPCERKILQLSCTASTKRLPHLFRAIVGKAGDFLQGRIRQREMPPKPTLDIDMAEFRAMRNLMITVRDEAKGIRHLQDKVLPDLKQQFTDATGIFKGKERKLDFALRGKSIRFFQEHPKNFCTY